MIGDIGFRPLISHVGQGNRDGHQRTQPVGCPCDPAAGSSNRSDSLVTDSLTNWFCDWYDWWRFKGFFFYSIMLKEKKLEEYIHYTYRYINLTKTDFKPILMCFKSPMIKNHLEKTRRNGALQSTRDFQLFFNEVALKGPGPMALVRHGPQGAGKTIRGFCGSKRWPISMGKNDADSLRENVLDPGWFFLAFHKASDGFWRIFLTDLVLKWKSKQQLWTFHDHRPQVWGFLARKLMEVPWWRTISWSCGVFWPFRAWSGAEKASEVTSVRQSQWIVGFQASRKQKTLHFIRIHHAVHHIFCTFFNIVASLKLEHKESSFDFHSSTV